jgi:hypothetical protein
MVIIKLMQMIVLLLEILILILTSITGNFKYKSFDLSLCPGVQGGTLVNGDPTAMKQNATKKL